MIHKVEIRDRRPGGGPGCKACGRRLEGRGRDLAMDIGGARNYRDRLVNYFYLL